MSTHWIAGKRVVVVAPAFHDWDLGSYVTRILARKGAHVVTFGYARIAPGAKRQRQLLAMCRRTRPHLLFGLKLDGIDAATVRRIRDIGSRISLWYVDCFGPAVPDWIASLLPEVDVFFTSAKGLLPAYADIAPTPAYWAGECVYLPAFSRVPHAAADRRLFGSQVAFVGSVYHPAENTTAFERRAQLFNRIGARYDLTIWGRQYHRPSGLKRCTVIEWPAYHHDMVRICRSSDIVLGINFINSIELYFSNRTYLTLAAGGFHLTHYVPGLETMFENHRHLVWYRSTPECLDLLDHYLKRPTLRRRIADEGQRWVRRRFSMTQQVGRMLERIERHGG
jgi:hypothetical protein